MAVLSGDTRTWRNAHPTRKQRLTFFDSADDLDIVGRIGTAGIGMSDDAHDENGVC